MQTHVLKEKAMRWFLMVCLYAILPVEMVVAGEQEVDVWKTYRSAKFGYELSYPAEMEYVSYFDGASGELRDGRSGRAVAEFEVWPPGQCPSQAADTQAREIGVQRAKDVTQADGHASSSYCGDPMTVREISSFGNNKIYELELTCISEVYPDAGDDEMEAEPENTVIDTEPIVTNEGKKGPTYFVDISQSWRKRVLMADPIGVDPRRNGAKDQTIVPVLLKILTTMRTFAVEKPAGICIEDLIR